MYSFVSSTPYSAYQLHDHLLLELPTPEGSPFHYACVIRLDDVETLPDNILDHLVVGTTAPGRDAHRRCRCTRQHQSDSGLKLQSSSDGG